MISNYGSLSCACPHNEGQLPQKGQTQRTQQNKQIGSADTIKKETQGNTENLHCVRPLPIDPLLVVDPLLDLEHEYGHPSRKRVICKIPETVTPCVFGKVGIQKKTCPNAKGLPSNSKSN